MGPKGLAEDVRQRQSPPGTLSPASGKAVPWQQYTWSESALILVSVRVCSQGQT